MTTSAAVQPYSAILLAALPTIVLHAEHLQLFQHDEGWKMQLKPIEQLDNCAERLIVDAATYDAQRSECGTGSGRSHGTLSGEIR